LRERGWSCLEPGLDNPLDESVVFVEKRISRSRQVERGEELKVSIRSSFVPTAGRVVLFQKPLNLDPLLPNHHFQPPKVPQHRAEVEEEPVAGGAVGGPLDQDPFKRRVETYHLAQGSRGLSQRLPLQASSLLTTQKAAPAHPNSKHQIQNVKIKTTDTKNRQAVAKWD
jgi:hypothetical protein